MTPVPTQLVGSFLVLPCWEFSGDFAAEQSPAVVLNSEANALTNLGSSVDEYDLLPGAVVQLSKSVVEKDLKESRALQIKAARLSLDENGILYRRTFDGPLAFCLGLGDTDYVLREIHEGTCENHFGTDSLVRNVIRAIYYWDNMEKDTMEFV
uniref:Integrase zinc-binding domain-containing protein n=1 Tax=Nicotiana tabacum TaxID=4097 RepID=A0A1S4CS37_TOBAC|nr:PREDICTED: uncharacterized protein LOC107822096 [Nicotiana tabacum]